ncbi:MAG TPA: hypothetical protein VGV57_12520 [Thermoleophilaceae bacterium]|nr:hypothetical protein [Thermoleophilaceae bacterium]
MTLDDRQLERFLEACGVSADEAPVPIERARVVAADSETALVRVAVDHGRVVAEVEPAGEPALGAG